VSPSLPPAAAFGLLTAKVLIYVVSVAEVVPVKEVKVLAGAFAWTPPPTRYFIVNVVLDGAKP